MKCVLCGKRKGKRFCPAKNGSICAQCCGEKRVIEVDCPADCVYLQSGQSYQWTKQMIARIQRSEDPFKEKKLYLARQKYLEVLLEMEAAIVEYAATLRALTDQQVLEAVQQLQSTYQTEEKGLIYEHSSANPLIQSLFRALRDRLEALRSDPQKAAAAIARSNDVLLCLEVLENDVRYHLKRGGGGDGYLKFIKRNHPDAAAPPSSGGGLIVPR